MSPLANAVNRVRDGLAEIRKNGSDLHWWEQRVLHRMAKPYHDTMVGNKGEFVMDKDWDILVLLDGCRMDLYEEVTGTSVDTDLFRGLITPNSWPRT